MSLLTWSGFSQTTHMTTSLTQFMAVGLVASLLSTVACTTHNNTDDTEDPVAGQGGSKAGAGGTGGDKAGTGGSVAGAGGSNEGGTGGSTEGGTGGSDVGGTGGGGTGGAPDVVIPDPDPTLEACVATGLESFELWSGVNDTQNIRPGDERILADFRLLAPDLNYLIDSVDLSVSSTIAPIALSLHVRDERGVSDLVEVSIPTANVTVPVHLSNLSLSVKHGDLKVLNITATVGEDAVGATISTALDTLHAQATAADGSCNPVETSDYTEGDQVDQRVVSDLAKGTFTTDIIDDSGYPRYSQSGGLISDMTCQDLVSVATARTSGECVRQIIQHVLASTNQDATQSNFCQDNDTTYSLTAFYPDPASCWLDSATYALCITNQDAVDVQIDTWRLYTTTHDATGADKTAQKNNCTSLGGRWEWAAGFSDADLTVVPATDPGTAGTGAAGTSAAGTGAAGAAGGAAGAAGDAAGSSAG